MAPLPEPDPPPASGPAAAADQDPDRESGQPIGAEAGQTPTPEAAQEPSPGTQADDENDTAGTGAAQDPPPDSEEAINLQAYWDRGLRFKNADESFRLRVGGRIHIDFSTMNGTGALGSTFSTDPPGIIEDGSELRRARFYLTGDIYDNFLYRIEYDFSNDDARAIAVYVGWGDTPIGEVRAGFQKEPMSLERMMSTNDITFIERGLPVDLTSFRSFGIENIDGLDNGRMYWSFGLFGESQAIEGDSIGEGEYAGTGRITGLPVYENEGRQLLHLGASGSIRNPPDEVVTLGERPETHLAPRLISTGPLLAEKTSIYAFEAAAVLGPVSLQGEYIGTHIENIGAPDSTLWGYYGLVSWFLTGEHRPYRNDQGRFTRLRPINNFNPQTGGSGAVELALRYSSLTYEDVTFPDQTLTDWTVGLNWYLNESSRVMLNYVEGELDTLSGAFRALTIRFQAAF